MFGWLKKGLKAVGKGAWWAAKRPETQIAVTAFWPSSLMIGAISAVRIAQSKEMTGEEKKAFAISQIAQFAMKAGFTKKSDLNKLIEDALAVVEARAQTLEAKGG
jgi:hypothetical protein